MTRQVHIARLTQEVVYSTWPPESSTGENWDYPVEYLTHFNQALTWLPYVAVSHGYWGPDGFVRTSIELVTIHSTEDEFALSVDDTTPSLETGVDTTSTISFHLKDDIYGEVWDQTWQKFGYEILGVDPIFTDGDDAVDLGALTDNAASWGLESEALDGNDTVQLPSVDDAQRLSKFGWSTSTFHGGLGDDRLIGRNNNDILYGEAGNDTIKAGDGIDTVYFEGTRAEYLPFKDVAYFYEEGTIVHKKTKEADKIGYAEHLVFEDETFVVTRWAESRKASKIPKYNKWNDEPMHAISSKGYADELRLILGTPTLQYNAKGQLVGVIEKSHHVADIFHKGLDLHVGGLRNNTIEQATSSLEKIFNRAAKLSLPLPEKADLLDNIESEGMYNPRFVGKSTTLSPHVWGVALDLSVDGILDYVPDGKLHLGLAKLTELFNANGWYAGSAFQDDMHFELSREKLEDLFPIHRGDGDHRKLMGTRKDDVFIGSRRAETMSGGDGHDTFKPGAGADVIRGGAERDYVIFSTLGGEADRLVDFSSRDEINFDAAEFSDIGRRGSALAKKYFVKGDAAQNGNHRIIYDQESGSLWYDGDGLGGEDQVLVAQLSLKPDLGAGDFFIV